MAVIFEKHIPLTIGTGLGAYTISTTSGSYVENPNPAYFRIDTSQYSSGTFHYEAVIKTSAATAYASLYSSGGVQVSSSEVTTTSTSPSRIRSSAITISPAGDYTDRIKNDGSNTTTFYGGRVVVTQNGSNISSTETQVAVFSYTASTTTSASYTDTNTIGTSFFLYTAANWNGTVNIYHEANIKTSTATAYAALFTTGGSQVSSSEVTTTSTSTSRIRSGAITLVDGTAYKTQIKNDGSNTTTITGSRLIVQQSGTPTKSEGYIPLSIGLNVDTVTGGAFQDDNGRFFYDTTQWNLDSISWFTEYSYNSNDAAGQLDAYALTSAAEVSGSLITTSITTTRVRSSALTMPGSSQEITTRGKSVGTVYHAQTCLVAVMAWTNVIAGSALFFAQI